LTAQRAEHATKADWGTISSLYSIASISRVHFLSLSNCAPADVGAYATNKSTLFAKYHQARGVLYSLFEGKFLQSSQKLFKSHFLRISRIERHSPKNRIFFLFCQNIPLGKLI